MLYRAGPPCYWRFCIRIESFGTHFIKDEFRHYRLLFSVLGVPIFRRTAICRAFASAGERYRPEAFLVGIEQKFGRSAGPGAGERGGEKEYACVGISAAKTPENLCGERCPFGYGSSRGYCLSVSAGEAFELYDPLADSPDYVEMNGAGRAGFGDGVIPREFGVVCGDGGIGLFGRHFRDVAWNGLDLRVKAEGSEYEFIGSGRGAGSAEAGRRQYPL